LCACGCVTGAGADCVVLYGCGCVTGEVDLHSFKKNQAVVPLT
jgi:hypothetical protein